MDCPTNKSGPLFSPATPHQPSQKASISANFDNLHRYYEAELAEHVQKLDELRNEKHGLRCSLEMLSSENASLKEEHKAAASKLKTTVKELLETQLNLAKTCTERSNAREEAYRLRGQVRSTLEDFENLNKVHTTYKELSEIRVADLNRNLAEEFLSWKRQVLLDLRVKLHHAYERGDNTAWQSLLEELDSAIASPEFLTLAATPGSTATIHQLHMKQKEDALQLKEQLIRDLEVNIQRFQLLLGEKDAKIKRLTVDNRKLHSRSSEVEKNMRAAFNANKTPRTPKTGTAPSELLTPQLALSAVRVFLSQPISSYPDRQRRRRLRGSIDGVEEFPVDQDELIEPAAKRPKVCNIM